MALPALTKKQTARPRARRFADNEKRLAFAALRATALVLAQVALANADVLRRNFDEFVVIDELDR